MLPAPVNNAPMQQHTNRDATVSYRLGTNFLYTFTHSYTNQGVHSLLYVIKVTRTSLNRNILNPGAVT